MTVDDEAIETGHGDVSTRFQTPDGASALLVLGHGAGADMTHHHMQSLADALAEQGIATFRFNFPFRQAGRNRVDPIPVCVDTLRHALTAAQARCELPCFLGGHSFGGRMASHLAAEAAIPVRGLIYFSFPLHSANRPETKRAAHLPAITLPQLFLSGTRDALADPTRLHEVLDPLPQVTLHELETADHSYSILKRTRQSSEDVYAEAARVTRHFIDSLV